MHASHNLTPPRLNRKIAKNIRKAAHQKLNTTNPIDFFIDQCFDIHEELQRSSRMLNRFTEELQRMSEYLDNARGDDMFDCVTMYNDDDMRVIDHRLTFDILDVSDKQEIFKQNMAGSIRATIINDIQQRATKHGLSDNNLEQKIVSTILAGNVAQTVGETVNKTNKY